MAMQTQLKTLGVDVAKDWLDIDDGERHWRIDNNARAIGAFLRQLEAPVQLAIEASNRFHLLMVEAAIDAGHRVYVIDPYRLSRYREGVGVRAKTDPLDARLLRRYLLAEGAHLRAYQAPPAAVQRLLELLQARAKLSEAKTSLRLALQHVTPLAATRRALVRRLDLAMQQIDQHIGQCLNDAGYHDDYRRCLTVPGIGPLNAAALVAAYHRGSFCNADAFIAFLGLDVRVRESGRFRGKRKLTKRGNPQLRRLLFNGARSGSRTRHWNDAYAQLRERGLSTTAATVAIARKLARLVFAILRDQTSYHAKPSMA